MKQTQPAALTIFAPTPNGGLAEHVHYQASELVARGIDVTVLCSRNFIKPSASTAYRQRRCLLSPGGKGLVAKLAHAAASILNYYILAWRIVADRSKIVLLEANSEYFALFWAWPHILLRLFGVRYLANFHDPLRQRRFGPQWLHDATIWLAYAPLVGGLIHGPPPPGSQVPPRLKIALAPVGIYWSHSKQPAAQDMRKRLNIAGDAFLLLAFGHIADRKNLDLLIRALVECGDVHLLIVGQTTSSRDRPARHYIELAESIGVADRVYMVADFVPEADIPGYFLAADAVALTYAGGFVSQSGVLQIAANWDKPVLASGGQGPLRDCMQEFAIGEFVEPDSVSAIVDGIARIRSRGAPDSHEFERYRSQASWTRNIDALLEVIS